MIAADDRYMLIHTHSYMQIHTYTCLSMIFLYVSKYDIFVKMSKYDIFVCVCMMMYMIVCLLYVSVS